MPKSDMTVDECVALLRRTLIYKRLLLKVTDDMQIYQWAERAGWHP